MAVVFEPTKGLTDKPLHYCPGCTHGIIHRIIAESMVEMVVTSQLRRKSSMRLLRFVKEVKYNGSCF